MAMHWTKAALAACAITVLSLAGPSLSQPTTEASAEAVSSRAVALKAADLMERDYLYPGIGERYAAAIRANAEAGKYDALSGEELADALTTDLLAVHPDGHVRVMFGDQGGGPGPRRIVVGPPPSGAAPAPGAGPAGPTPRRIQLAPMEEARWIAPGIAFVRFNLFPLDPAIDEATAKFMADHADAKVIIFDIRTHRGGGVSQMDRIFPWLFAKDTRLATMATRDSVFQAGRSPIAEEASMRPAAGNKGFVTLEHWAKPNGDKRLHDAKIYVLTSTVSGSAAEHFALAMKHTGRGTLVGSHTAGANHFGGMQDLGGGFRMFLPVGRTYDPVTGKDWEGTGVLPDIDVAPEDALVTVLMKENIGEAEARRLSAEVAPSAPMVRPSRDGGPVRVPAPQPQ